LANKKRRNASTRKAKKRSRKYSSRRFKLAVFLLSLVSAVSFAVAAVFTYHTLRFSALVDSKLVGESSERPATVYARPFELRKGQRLSRDELIAVLNDLGYREQPSLTDAPGTFALSEGADTIQVRRRGEFRAPVTVDFDRVWVSSLHESRSGANLERIDFDRVLVTTLFGADRSKRRFVPLEEIPAHVSQAILATEDRRFYSHTGFDPIGIGRALAVDLLSGELRQGASTITQQLVKNYFLSPERSWRRKILEAYLAVLLESRTTKDEILELYLNEVYLGQRGSFAINGVEQAAQTFFGKNVGNLTIAESALLAAMIRAPNASSPYRHPEPIRQRRDVVLRQMVDAGFIDETTSELESARPLGLVEGTIDRGEAPYFIDALTRELTKDYDAGNLQTRGLSVYSTMDPYLQNRAQQAVVEGLEEIRSQLSQGGDVPQAALVALSPQTGDVLAIVGASSYGTSQFNRAVDAHRQPGSAFKPFVYLAAFENGGDKSGAATPATIVVDEPTTFRQAGKSWTPQNYSRRFEGRVSYRRALALSLNVATARIGQDVGFDRVVALWEAMGMSSELSPYPSLVLGAFEVTPLELATAYAVLANGGRRVEPRFYTRLIDSSGAVLGERPVVSRPVASPESAYLVTDMLGSVLSFGTAREIRARGFTADAAGKTGTTNDNRDAWFVGYTPDVLTAVWVGYDDNRPLGLTGSQAALPIWTRFMKAAVSGREKERFTAPAGIVFVDIDPANGLRAGPNCPTRQREAFRSGTQPTQACGLH
jgi:penicillin-binding protein 1B